MSSAARQPRHRPDVPGHRRDRSEDADRRASAGRTALETKQLLDVDRLDPRAEMELSPSMPFRRRGERRLMIIDDTGDHAAPGSAGRSADQERPAPRQGGADRDLPGAADPARPAVRARQLGRRGARRAQRRATCAAICLLPWALDPQVDVDGKRRATPLSQKEFEAKIIAFEKRLEELDEQQIIASLVGRLVRAPRRPGRRRRARGRRHVGPAQVDG